MTGDTNVFVREGNIPRDRYYNEEYFSRNQFDALVSQIIAVYKLKPQKILEIGKGNGFVSNFLKSSGIQVTTFDINNSLKPDVVGNIIEIDKYFQNNSFDLILCAEVIEHIPFEHFEIILEKFKSITSANVIITLPRRHRTILDLRAYIKVPSIRPLNVNVFYRIPDGRNECHEGHCWEIDFRPMYSLDNISKLISKYFKINANYIDERARRHQFFILRK